METEVRAQQTSTNPGISTGGSGGLNYVYDFENHLIQQGGATMVYDGDGNRVSKTVAGVTTTYLVSEVNPTGYVQVLTDRFSGGSGAQEVLHNYVYGLTCPKTLRTASYDARLTAEPVFLPKNLLG